MGSQSRSQKSIPQRGSEKKARKTFQHFRNTNRRVFAYLARKSLLNLVSLRSDYFDLQFASVEWQRANAARTMYMYMYMPINSNQKKIEYVKIN